MMPLHTACAHGSRDVTELLLKHGANPRSKDKQLKTPMHYAAAHDEHAQIVHLLFEAVWIMSGEDAAMVRYQIYTK